MLSALLALALATKAPTVAPVVALPDPAVYDSSCATYRGTGRVFTFPADWKDNALQILIHDRKGDGMTFTGSNSNVVQMPSAFNEPGITGWWSNELATMRVKATGNGTIKFTYCVYADA